MPDEINSMFIMRHGFAVLLKDDPKLYHAVQARHNDELFKIGPYLYTRNCKPVAPNSPAIEDTWDALNSSKRVTPAKLRGREDKMTMAAFRQVVSAATAPAGHERRLDSLPSDKYLKMTCKRCGRVRHDAIGYLVRTSRLGDRSLAQLEQALQCARIDCMDLLKIEFEE